MPESTPKPPVDTATWDTYAYPPKAQIRRVGRWTYRITIHDGPCEYGPGAMGVVVGWHAWGRRRAERKARRKLARYLRDQERCAEKWEVS